MGVISEESRFLLRNWDVVEEVLRAVERAERELSALLMGVERDLERRSWWGEGWVFERHQSAQVYISNREWRVGEGYAIWIGVERFTLSGLFGGGAPPILYVWVSGKRYDLVEVLVEMVEEGSGEVLGEVNRRADSGYVVRKMVRKYLPEEVEGFEEEVRGDIVEFFEHYARLLWGFNDRIRNYLERMEAGV